MEQLPLEICRAIVRQLDLPSLKSIRLTSHGWASIGEEYLIPPVFTSLPHRDEQTRLRAISRHPVYRLKLRTLVFNYGEFDERRARYDIPFSQRFIQYLRDSGSGSLVKTRNDSWAVYDHIKEKREAFRLDADTLTELFKQLPNLEGIEFSLRTCPFEAEHPDYLKQLWRFPATHLLRPTTYFRRQVAMDQGFTDFLAAVMSNLSTLNLKTLTSDEVPLRFSEESRLDISLLSTVFASLTTLKLLVEYKPMSMRIARNRGDLQILCQNLSRCLRSAPLLENLELAFAGWAEIDISTLLLSFNELGYCFQALENFTLQGVAATEIDLSKFILLQRSLKIVQLGGQGVKALHDPTKGGIHLLRGSFRGLFSRLKSHGQLAEIRLQGDLCGRESGERWVFDDVVLEEQLHEYVTD